MTRAPRRTSHKPDAGADKPLGFHPLADLFPLMVGAAFDGLVEDIKANGLLDTIVLHEDGRILDGRNRYLACRAAGVDARMEMFAGSDPLAFVISKNLPRRHLSESQRSMVAARLADMRQGERTDIEPSANLRKVAKMAQGKAAETLKVSPRSVSDAKKVQRQGTPELIAAVDTGILAVSAAARASDLDKDIQDKIAEQAKLGGANVVRTVIKRETRIIREAALATKIEALPDIKVGVVVADPEWEHEAWSKETGEDRAARQHYPTSPTAEIAARPVGGIAADDCVLFLWATASMLLDALRVMDAWGFTYKTHFIWAKDRKGKARGTGRWLTDEHELLLLGTKGSPPAPTGDLMARSLQHAPVTPRHSEKPELFAEIIERYFPNVPKIELNRRGAARPGWTAWGNEVEDAPAESEPAASPCGNTTGGGDRYCGLLEPDVPKLCSHRGKESECPDFAGTSPSPKKKRSTAARSKSAKAGSATRKRGRGSKSGAAA